METSVGVETDVIVKTRKGGLRGSVAYGVHTFKGIPYAAPPFGSHRFRAPQPVAPWSGVRDALAYGPKPPQLPYPKPFDVLLPEPALAGEDCLTLMDRIAGGTSAEIDLMVGSTRDEWRLFLVPNGVVDQITDELLGGAIAAYGLPLDATLASYRAARRGASAGDLLAAIQGDWYIRIPVLRLADAHAKNAKRAATYAYEFAWRSPRLSGRLGACHGLDVPFVFDTLGDGLEPLWGTNPPQPLADTMHAAWVAFATHGDSGWPEYEPIRRATMRFDTTSEVVDDPLSAERALWAGLR